MTDGPARLLGLDLGEARIGLALSDPLGLTAQPHSVLRRSGLVRDLAALAAVAREYDVRRVVLGLPLLLSGEEGSAARSARHFGQQLREHMPDVEVAFWDERMSTAQAERVLTAADVSRRRRRQVVDTMAAALLLQSYLDAARTPGASA